VGRKLYLRKPRDPSPRLLGLAFLTLYTIVTAGRAVEVSYSATGKVIKICLFSCKQNSRYWLATVT
jgi:hypothetical protein